jgi:hypothetical protein
MNLCFERTTTGFFDPVGSRATAFKSLLADLADWYDKRKPELHPTVEMEVDEQSFPVIFFPSGTSIYASIMYHTTMLLLLDNKPRTVQLDSRENPHMSSLWHARRVCGIALSNDRRACWDPCLLGAFFAASRRMTHEGQQLAIMAAMDWIEELGWSTASLKAQLRQEWGLET